MTVVSVLLGAAVENIYIYMKGTEIKQNILNFQDLK